MESRLHWTEWQSTQTTHHKGVHVERIQWHFQRNRGTTWRPIPHQTERTVQTGSAPPSRSVPVAMQDAYEAELERLTKEGIITEVKEHRVDQLHSTIDEAKQQSKTVPWPQRLEQSNWKKPMYSRTIDDILPELAKSKYKTLKDATSGYWHVVLDLASSLLTMFNTPWGKYRWLRLPFGLKIASDVFQERLDRVLRLLKGVHGTADNILTHGETEIQHDGRLLTLLETARMNNL